MWRKAGFLGEFALGAGEQIVRPHEALWNGPGALILARPEGPARMGEQKFRLFLPAEGEQTRTELVAT
jgi:hypothetical protein